MLQTVWIFSITAVSRTATWLNISHVPRFWPQRMQKGRGIHSSRPFFNVVRLHDDAALFAPELVQCQNHFLKIHCKFHSFFDLQNQQKISRSCHTDRDERLYSRGSTLIDTVLRTMPTLRMQLQSALHQNAASGSHHPRFAVPSDVNLLSPSMSLVLYEIKLYLYITPCLQGCQLIFCDF